MRINNNLMAMNTHRQLGINNSAGAKSIEKLSSGYKINRAGDDAAGLAISEKMRAQIRGLNMASKNSQDGISLIQTAEGALNETHAILQRMRELAVQSANDTNVTVDRGEIQKEMNQLTSEINRIGNTTEFNTMKLLNGDRALTVSGSATTVNSGVVTVSNVVGYTVTATNSTNLKNALGSITTVAGEFAAGVAGQSAKISIQQTTGGYTVTITGSAGSTLTGAVDVIGANENGDYVYNDHGISFTITAAEHATISSGSTVAISGNISSAAQTFSLISDYNTNTGNVSITSGITVSKDADLAAVREIRILTQGAGSAATTISLHDSAGTALFTDALLSSGAGVVAYNNHGLSFTITLAGTGAATVSASISLTGLGTTTINSYDDTNAIKFQVGSNEAQSMSLDVSDMRAAALGIASTSTGGAFKSTKEVTNGTSSTNTEYALDVSTHAKAGASVTVINAAIETVSGERSKLGAIQNRLEHTIKNLDTSAENLQAAESRIRDVDMAKEMMNFTKNNILTQAAQAMLAQANQAPQGVLQLLR